MIAPVLRILCFHRFPFSSIATALTFFKAELIQGVLFNLVRLVRKGARELTTRKSFVFQLDHAKFRYSDSLNDQSC